MNPALSPGGAASLEQDWLNRSTATGVMNAEDFRNAATFNAGIFPNSSQGDVSRDTTEFLTGTACLKTDVPAASSGTPAWIFKLDSTWNATNTSGIGSSDLYVQFRIKLGPNRLVPSNGGGGFKIFIMGGLDITGGIANSNSHTNDEFVISTYNWQIPSPYFETGNGTPPLWEPNGGGGDLFLQPAGNQLCLYSELGAGLPHCWQWPVGEWFTVMYRVRYANPGGTTGNQMDLYVARYGQTSYTQLFASRDFAIGSPDPKYPNGPNSLWMTPYDTGRVDSSVSTWHKYTQIIASRNFISCPQVYL